MNKEYMGGGGYMGVIFPRDFLKNLMEKNDKKR